MGQGGLSVSVSEAAVRWCPVPPVVVGGWPVRA